MTAPTDSVLRRHHEQMQQAAGWSGPADSAPDGSQGQSQPAAASDVPTDSVLRRHHQQMQQAARLVPTDSVLRRHYEQMQQAARASVGPGGAPEPEEAAPPRPVEPPAASRPAAPREPAPSRPAAAPEPAPTSQGGGFFGWLKRLFGG